jgi:addiction module RelE/StbE family toxin
VKIKAEKRFKEDYVQLEKRVKDPVSFRKALNKAIKLLQANKDICRSFPVNRLIKRGEGWFDCYITSDIVMIYRVQGRSVKLTALGPTKKCMTDENFLEKYVKQT